MTTSESDDIREIDPETASPEQIDIDRVRDGLRSDENLVRTHAAQVTTVLAAEDPRAVEPLVPTLTDMFDDDRSVVLKEVLFSLSLLAEEDPDALVDATGGLLSVLDHDLPVVRSAGARAIRPLAVERPAAFVDHVDDLLAVVEQPVSDPTEGLEPSPNDGPIRAETVENVREQAQRRQHSARVVAATALVEIADIAPQALSAHCDALIALLDDDSPAIRAASAGALAALAERDPDALAGAVDPLTAVLDDVDEATRARAVAALGFLGDEDAVEPLRELAADEDADDDLREMAAETADFLAAQ